jgi:hypothetical protein
MKIIPAKKVLRFSLFLLKKIVKLSVFCLVCLLFLFPLFLNQFSGILKWGFLCVMDRMGNGGDWYLTDFF